MEHQGKRTWLDPVSGFKLPLALAGDAGKNNHDAQPQVSKKQEKRWRALWDREAEGRQPDSRSSPLDLQLGILESEG